MEIINNFDEINNIKNNQIIGEFILDNSSIEFKGENNIMYFGKNIKLKNTKLRFTGNNSLIYIDDNYMPISLNGRVGNDSVLYLGKNTYINRGIEVYATERKNIIIGDDCMLSYETCFRTSDPHPIYDVKTCKRINYAKSIYIGDHVWIGQQCLILKNSKIYSGSIIGGHSVISGKEIYSNTSWAGNPSKLIKEGVFFTCESAHDFTSDDLTEKSVYDKDDFIYENDVTNLSFDKIEKDLEEFKDVKEKLNYIQNIVASNNQKNRFAKRLLNKKCIE